MIIYFVCENYRFSTILHILRPFYIVRKSSIEIHASGSLSQTLRFFVQSKHRLSFAFCDIPLSTVYSIWFLILQLHVYGNLKR